MEVDIGSRDCGERRRVGEGGKEGRRGRWRDGWRERGKGEKARKCETGRNSGVRLRQQIRKSLTALGVCTFALLCVNVCHVHVMCMSCACHVLLTEKLCSVGLRIEIESYSNLRRQLFTAHDMCTMCNTAKLKGSRVIHVLNVHVDIHVHVKLMSKQGDPWTDRAA